MRRSLLTLLAALVLTTAGSGEAARAPCAPSWRETPSPESLFRIDAKTSEVWVVGETATYRSSGGRFAPVKKPPDWKIKDVAVLGVHDVWVAAIEAAATGASRLLFARWDGRSWRSVSRRFGHIPSFAAKDCDEPRVAIDGRARNDVWAIVAVGDCSRGDIEALSRVYADHWDGRRWSRSRPLYEDIDIQVGDLDVVSSREVWVAFEAGLSDTYGFLLHWDGGRWRSPKIPDPPCSWDESGWGLLDVTHRGLTPLAIGYTPGPCSYAAERAGKSFWIVPRLTSFGLSAADADTAKTAWLAGNTSGRSLLLRGDADGWKRVPAIGEGIEDVAAAAAGDIWTINGDVIAHLLCR